MTKLKGNRDKLLERFDKKWGELNRLGLEYKATSDETIKQDNGETNN